MKKYLLLITKSPHHPNTKKALIFAKQQLAQGTPVLDFFMLMVRILPIA